METNSVNLNSPWYTKLHYQIFAAMGLGIILGFTVGDPAATAVGWMGTVFLQTLRMLIIPLVLASLTSGVASIGTGRELGRLGAKTIGYYALSSFLAIFVGLFFVNLIRPGIGAEIAGVGAVALPEVSRPAGAGEFALRMLLQLIPENPIRAMAEGQMLGVIGFSIILGAAIGHSPPEARDAGRRAFNSFFHILMVLTKSVIRFAPLGVLGLMTKAAVESGPSALVTLGKYVLTIACGLAVHALVILPLLLLFLGRINPRVHYRNMFDALVMAFSTASSGATLPVTLRCMEEKVGVSNRVASFVVPMGATINMDGTALFECVGVMFIGQALGVQLDFGQQMTIVITAFAASVGAAAIPKAGLVMIFIVLEAVGLQGPEAMLIVGAMLAIDRPLDMLRTSINVFSDSCGAAIVARSEGETTVDVVGN
jgi:Na+/H+-dicarboxylate symporter